MAMFWAHIDVQIMDSSDKRTNFSVYIFLAQFFNDRVSSKKECKRIPMSSKLGKLSFRDHHP